MDLNTTNNSWSVFQIYQEKGYNNFLISETKDTLKNFPWEVQIHSPSEGQAENIKNNQQVSNWQGIL